MAQPLQFHYQGSLLPPRSQNSKRLFTSWQNGIKEVCLSGGRGCGKTIDLLLYALRFCRRVSGFRIVWARSEYATIKTTVIPTLEHRIFKYPMGDSKNKHPMNPFILEGGTNSPKRLLFDNKSEIRFIGLDSKSKTRGLECDLAILNEGSREDTSEAWGEMGAVQSGGRGGAWYVKGNPFNQLITDSNPDAPTHWIYKNFRNENPDDNDTGIYDFGDKLWLGYTDTDNPLHCNEDGSINELGKQKKEDLLRFYKDGFERQRMAFHQWVAAIGMVYSMWEPDTMEVKMDKSDFKENSKWYMGLDLGGTVPFAACFVNVDQKGKQKMYKEIVKSQCLLEDVEAEMTEIIGDIGLDKKGLTIVSDTNVPEFIARLKKRGWNVIKAEKGPESIVSRVDLGKKTIRNGDLEVNIQSLLKKDHRYDGPQGFKEEIRAYAYYPEDKQASLKNPNLPMNKNDHSMNAWEYLNKYLTKPKVSGDFQSVSATGKAKHQPW